MKFRSARAIIALICSCGVLPASAATLLDTTPAGTGGAALEYFSVPGNVQSPFFSYIAVEFSSPTAATITAVQAAIFGYTTGGFFGNINLGVMNDAGGVPSGSFISGEYSLVLSPSSPVNLTSLSWSISAGTYWLAAVVDPLSTNFDGGWYFNPNSSVTWASANNASGGVWLNGGNAIEGAPAALITAELSATPLPATLPLLVTGLGAMGLLGWRRKRKAQAVA
jgi:hypothetical protein